VSGKGIAAAAFMLVSHTAMSIFANQYIEPNKVLELANNYLEHDNKESMFTTTFYGILNVETGEFIYSNGGHNPPLHINNQSYSFIERTANPALGIISDLEYGIRSIHLQPGDKIIMFTDGVSEAQNLMNEEYGENRIVETIRNNSALSPKELNEKLFENLEKFRNTAMQFDDITIFSFQWK
jgi:sigma-B regulation protein RsbU (phosphoserine phosphatase)